MLLAHGLKHKVFFIKYFNRLSVHFIRNLGRVVFCYSCIIAGMCLAMKILEL